MSRIFKRGKYYAYDGSFNGKRYRLSLRTINKADAIKRQRELDHRLYLGKKPANQDNILIRHAYIEYQRDRNPERRPRTNATFNSRMNILINYLESIDAKYIADITPETILRFKEHLRANKRSNLTYNHYLETIKAFINWIVVWRKDWLNMNPLTNLQRIGGAANLKREIPKHFSKAEIFKIYEIIKGDIYLWAYVKFVVNTGLRPEESANIEWSDIFFDQHHPQVKVISKPEKDYYIKTYQDRTVPLNTEALKALEVLPKGSGYIFNHGKSYWQRKFSKALHSAGIYDGRGIGNLRHTYGAEHAKAGQPTFILKTLMGHSSIKTTEIYINLRFNEVKDSANLINI